MAVKNGHGERERERESHTTMVTKTPRQQSYRGGGMLIRIIIRAGRPTGPELFIRSIVVGLAGTAGLAAMLARRRCGTILALWGTAAGGHSVITLGGRAPASAASSWNSDSSGSVSL